MSSYSIRSTAAAALFALTMVISSPASAAAGGEVVGYYNVFNGPSGIDTIQWDSLTVLNLAFIAIDPGSSRIAWLDQDGVTYGASPQLPISTVRAIVAARDAHNPKVKLVLSVGGWTLSHQFSRIAGDPAAMSTFAESCGTVVNAFKLDGIDIDWEYPTRLGAKNCAAGQVCQSSQDADNFAMMLAMIRSALPKQDSLLTVAVYFDPSSRGIPYNVSLMNAYVDHFNIMAYDIVAPNWHPATGFHAGFGASVKSLQAFAAAGADKSKLNLGVPFYGYIWSGVPAGATGAVATGPQRGKLYSTPALVSRYSNDTNCALQSSEEGDSYFCAAGEHAGEWAAVDTQKVIADKAHYVRDHGYGGLMSWELTYDVDGSLTRLMASEQR